MKAPLPAAALRALSMGEPQAMAQFLTLFLQAFDNQPGISIPFRSLDYARVIVWLKTALALDPVYTIGQQIAHGIDRVLRPINLPNKHSVS